MGTPRNLQGTRVMFVFSPEVMVQYDNLVSGPNKYLLFLSHDEALRVGPQIVLRLWYDPVNFTDPVLRTILKRSTVSFTYHSSWDVYTARNYNTFQSTFTYNLTDAGNFAVSASYGFGNAEISGNQTSQFKVGLAAKF